MYVYIYIYTYIYMYIYIYTYIYAYIYISHILDDLPQNIPINYCSWLPYWIHVDPKSAAARCPLARRHKTASFSSTSRAARTVKWGFLLVERQLTVSPPAKHAGNRRHPKSGGISALSRSRSCSLCSPWECYHIC